MAYYDALTTKWATLSGDTAAKLAAINAAMASGPAIDVPVSAVVGYLATNAKLAGLQAFAAAPPSGDTNASAILAAKELCAIIMCPNAPAFGTSSSGVASVVTSFLEALASDTNTGITSGDVAALLALATTSIPWWRSAGYTSPISQGDLDAAGGLT